MKIVKHLDLLSVPASDPGVKAVTEHWNTNGLYLPANTTSHIQPLDGGIIVNFKAKFKMLFIRWIITVLDSGVSRDSEKCRPNMYQAIQWALTAWDEVTAYTIKNCWNKVKILPAPIVVAGGGTRDDVFDELRALLVSLGEECDLDVRRSAGREVDRGTNRVR